MSGSSDVCITASLTTRCRLGVKRHQAIRRWCGSMSAFPRKRPNRRQVANDAKGPEPDEVQCSKTIYSITSSAVVSNDCGIVRPNVLAVLRLITNSNLVGNCTGVARLLAFQDPVHEGCRLPVIVCHIIAVGHETTGLGEVTDAIDGRKWVLFYQRHDFASVSACEAARHQRESGVRLKRTSDDDRFERGHICYRRRGQGQPK
jgi:hypothetical protein